MDWIPIFVSAILAFILGFFAASFASGVRRMLATKIIKKKLVIGHISKSIQKQDSTVFWCIPIMVKASVWWNLLVSSVEDVKALITFVRSKKQFQTVWINPNVNDSSLITLRIGTEHEIGLAEESSGVLKSFGGMTSYDTLAGDDDILLELRTGYTTLGYWLFQKAIVGGLMQEVDPIIQHHH